MGSIQTENNTVAATVQGRRITFTKVYSNYTLTPNDSFLAVDCSENVVNITLPSAAVGTDSSRSSQPVYRIKKVDDTFNRVNILTIGGQTIDKLDRFFLEEPNEAINLIGDGYNWLIF